MEKTIEAKRTGKGIRMDVYVAENGGTVVHDIEMQTSREDDLQKRIRYYQGLIMPSIKVCLWQTLIEGIITIFF